MNIRRKPDIYTFLYIGVFLFTLTWFTQIHPLSVYDADDWRYISHVRRAIPLWHDWNPSRVFPEVFMPLLSGFAVHCLMPFTGDYLTSITGIHAFVIALSITVYVFCFTRMVKHLVSLSDLGAVFSGILFLILHFLIFRSYDNGNTYLFYCWDLTCYYYYLIPSLINASLVMCLIATPDITERICKMSWEKQGLLLTLIYFSIFSNLPASGILAAFAGSAVLISILQHIFRKKSVSLFLKENILYIGILLLWLISAVFELSGGRAGDQDMGVRMPILQGIRVVAYTILHLPQYCNHSFLAIAGLSIVGALVLLLHSRFGKITDKKIFETITLSIVAFLALIVYTTLLCAVVDVTYAMRMEYQFGFLFFLLIIVALAFAYTIQKLPASFLLVPILLIYLTGECNTLDRTFLESNQTNLDPQICTELSQDMIDQFIAADASGASSMTLYVPKWSTPGNWPHSLYLGDKISDSLYEHGIISRRITAVTCPTEDHNRIYNLPLPN